MIAPCQVLSETFGALFVCSEIDGMIRIRTPYLYPDGDVVDLFLEEGAQGVVLSDLGETLGWLRMQTAALRRTKKHEALIQDVCLTHGVELFRGMLQVRVQDAAGLSACLTRLGQAAVRVADLWFTYRNRVGESILEEVAELLSSRGIAYEQGKKLPGRSGQVWTVDFHTRTPRRSAFVSILSTGSRGVTRRLAEHNVALWHDLSHLQIGPEALGFVSLFDDTMDVWSPEDFSLVEPLSTICLWSSPDRFIETLAA